MQKQRVIIFFIAMSFIISAVGYVFAQRWNSERGGGGGGGNMPAFMKEILEQEGLSIEDLQKDPELRQKIMEKVRGQMQGDPEFRERMQGRMGDFRGGQLREAPPEIKGESAAGGAETPRIFEFQRGRGRKSDLPEKYSLISENNLFKPLGYEPPKSEVGYRLVGVVSTPDETKALIVENSGASYYVKTGTRLGNTIVDKISKDQVVLIQDGKQVDLRLEPMQFMSSPNVAAASSSGEGKGQPGASGGGGQPGEFGFAGKSADIKMPSNDEMNKMRAAEDGEREEMRRRFMEGGGGRRFEGRGPGPGGGGNFRGGGGRGGGDRIVPRGN